jgi:hypothetical protein
MDWIRDLVIAVIGGSILLISQWLWTHWREWRGELTGEWDQVIFDTDEPGDIVKRDKVECRQYGAVMHASIKRQYPENQRRRAWYFQGRYARGVILNPSLW